MQDLYTFTAPTFEWIDHEWGHDVIISKIYDLWGYTALAGLFALLWALSFIIVAARSRILILVIAAVAVLPYSGVRAVTWSVLLMAVFLILANAKNSKLKYLCLLLIVLWANLHGGFIIGLFLLAYYFVKTKNKEWLALLLLCSFATFLNPYGPRLYVEVVRTLTDSSLRSQIVEWSYFGFSDETLVFIVLWGAGFWLFGKKKRSNWFSLSTIMLLASMSASRNIPLFVLAAVNEVNEYFNEFKKSLPPKLNVNHKLVLGLSIVILVGWSIQSSDSRVLYRNHSRDYGFPAQAVEYINNHPCPGRVIFNSYNYGGYLVWKLPSHKIYIDGRMPTWRDENGIKYLDRQFKIFEDSEYRNQQFKEYGIKCVLLSGNVKELEIIKDLKKNSWKQVKEVTDSNLLIAPQ